MSTVSVVPLVDDRDASTMPGWCTYESTLKDAPEIEFICGGINSKTPEAVGLWRNGNLLHFGFDLSPAQMNDTGDALLVNSIVYISRFTEDRPIVRAPSIFVDTVPRPRSSLAGFLDREDYPLNFFTDQFDPAVIATVEDQSRAGYQAWFEANRAHLRSTPEGTLTWDREAKALDIAYDTTELFTRGIPALRDPATRDAAAALLHRYAPSGPDGDDAAAWQAWYEANAPYLFYSEYAMYRWYVDPLAKKRGVPTKELRGPKRADDA